MLRHVLSILCATVLVACQLGAADVAPDATSPITGDAIAVTSLDAPPDSAPETAVVAEDQPPAEAGQNVVPTESIPAAEVTAAEEIIPVVLKSPEQIQCERRDGTWARAGKSVARTCVKQTRDGGKECTKGTQCEGLCLARSGTCAPLAPLFGCNEIFEDDGRRVTLCID